jgi:hypothetical protein
LILLQDYSEKNYPSDSELEYIIRVEHSHSDLILPPLVSRITDTMNAGAGFDRYVDFLKRAIAVIDTFNHKPVMGVIPLRTPFIRISDLVEFYAKRGVTAYCLDFAANKPDTTIQSLEQVLFTLAETRQLDSSYIHAVNVSPGRPRSQTTTAPCHNILALGYGVDSFGDLHRTRMAPDNPMPPPAVIHPRLFLSKDYGDYLIRSRRDLTPFQGLRTTIPIDTCVGNRDAAKLLNTEFQSVESAKTGRLVLSSSELSKVSPYLGSKKFVPKSDLQSMSSLGAEISKRSRK